MKRACSVVSGLVSAGLVFSAGPALAYIGPGAGLSLLGALWGVVAAVAAALLFLLIWPLRRFMRRQRPVAQETAAARHQARQAQESTAARGR